MNQSLCVEREIPRSEHKNGNLTGDFIYENRLFGNPNVRSASYVFIMLNTDILSIFIFQYTYTCVTLCRNLKI